MSASLIIGYSSVCSVTLKQPDALLPFNVEHFCRAQVEPFHFVAWKDKKILGPIRSSVNLLSYQGVMSFNPEKDEKSLRKNKIFGRDVLYFYASHWIMSV